MADLTQIPNSKFTDPILKEIESVLFYIVQNYSKFIQEPTNTHEKISEYDKELGDFLDRYKQLYNITSNITEAELQTLKIELNAQIQDLKTKLSNNYFKGDKGDKGDQGLQGIQGEKGDSFTFEDFTPQQIEYLKIKGDKGDKGDQGIQGIQGEKGDQGIQGVQGEKGDKGDQGIQGIQGEKGEKGDKGDQGIQGIQGEKGDSFTFEDFTPQQIESLKIKGDKGDQGIQGIQGEKGEKGDQGIQGIQGEKGDRGNGFTFDKTKINLSCFNFSSTNNTSPFVHVKTNLPFLNIMISMKFFGISYSSSKTVDTVASAYLYSWQNEIHSFFSQDRAYLLSPVFYSSSDGFLCFSFKSESYLSFFVDIFLSNLELSSFDISSFEALSVIHSSSLSSQF